MDDPRLIVPPLDEEPWPTLGPEQCDWFEEYMVHGPGDVLGQPITLTDEERLIIYRASEVYPEFLTRSLTFGDTATDKHPRAGRRRFKRVAVSRRKGWRKTEFAAWYAILELDPNAPARCDGFTTERGERVPVGRPVVDPFIPMLAITEEQVEDLAYGAVQEILRRGPLQDDYIVTDVEVRPRNAPGKLGAYATAPSSRDGARTTFEHFDETHLLVLALQIRAHRTMLRNLYKRKIADAWALETTTMYGPGEGSVAEATHEFAIAIVEGRAKDARLYFDHRQASESWDINDDEQLAAALMEASGDAWEWTDLDSIRDSFRDPSADEAEERRYWLNQRRRLSSRWLAPMVWRSRIGEMTWPPDGADVVLSFDGSYNRDSTALLGATIEATPHVFVVKTWERPYRAKDWRTPRVEVEQEVEAALERWNVAELAPDPPGWHHEIEAWENGPFGGVVVRFETNQATRMGPACDEFEQAVNDGDMTHDGNKVLARHIGNCTTAQRGRFTVVVKPEPHSPDKIDSAVGAIVAYHRARWHHLNRKAPWAIA
jgi:hypothetical protein